MKQLFLFLIGCCLTFFAVAQMSADEKAIRNLMHTQSEAWNRGNLEEFMHGYWENDSLMFIGKSGITYGYQNTLQNYKKGYSNADQMGKLTFDILKVKKLSAEYCWVLGKWFLKRNAGDVGGHYTLLFRKIKGQWVIIADHSS